MSVDSFGSPPDQPAGQVQAGHPAAHAAHHHARPVVSRPAHLQPVPVVKMWSTRGVEYAMMSLVLWVSAISLSWLLLTFINSRNSFNNLVVPVSVLIISLPITTFFFIRLKKAELKNPVLRADPSRRRWTQATQFLAFVAIIADLITLVHQLLSHYSGANATSIAKIILDSTVVTVIAGCLLIYYWLDEHRPIAR